MRLEDLRGPHVGDSVLFLPAGEEPVTAAFHHHAEQAQWHTINCLVRLAGHPVDGVANEPIAVVEWWRTAESLIALIHVVALLESEHGLRPEQPRLTGSKRDGALDRWSAIARWFSGATDSPPKDVTRRLGELRDFRNSFEHASRHATVHIKSSRLGSVPAHANLADAMEAMAICIESASVLRYVLGGLDLMPQCVVPSRQHVFYVPLDELASELLFPQYRRVVAALGLESDVALYPTPSPLRGRSIAEPAVGIKALPDRTDVHLEEALDLWAASEEFVGSRPNLPTADQFGVPRYVLRSPSAEQS
jgi:hypothetical protein